jgi:diadenosine tetraphosphate (Ap4A) HIT family hydrolase
MAKSDCIFCKIVKNENPSFKIYEGRDCVAILDIYPNIAGQCVVIPKKHVGSYIFGLSDKKIADFMRSTKLVANLLERKLRVGRVHLVFEGGMVNHLHAKLYPAIGTNRRFEEVIAEERVYFESYPGYVCTLLGPRMSDKELRKVQKRITGK